MEGTAGAIGVGAIFVMVLTIVWITLPFAVFGIKPLLRKLIEEQKKLIEEQKKTNAWLADTYTVERDILDHKSTTP